MSDESAQDDLRELYARVMQQIERHGARCNCILIPVYRDEDLDAARNLADQGYNVQTFPVFTVGDGEAEDE